MKFKLKYLLTKYFFLEKKLTLTSTIQVSIQWLIEEYFQ